MVAASRVPRKPDPADWTPPLLVKEYDPNRKRRRKDQEVSGGREGACAGGGEAQGRVGGWRGAGAGRDLAEGWGGKGWGGADAGSGGVQGGGGEGLNRGDAGNGRTGGEQGRGCLGQTSSWGHLGSWVMWKVWGFLAPAASMQAYAKCHSPS